MTLYVQEVDIGLAADIGTLAYLPKIAGNHSLVRELAYTARTFSTEEADKLGLLSKVVEGGREEVVKAALDLAVAIAAKSPLAVAGTKHLISHARDHTYVIQLG
jgi:delta(3,5)-delta(2,4)-dienoyl-CoA isomerase